MQITINTADILGDETTIRDEVVAAITNAMRHEMRDKIATLVAVNVETALRDAVKEQMAEIVAIHLDTPFCPADIYGNRKPETTLRRMIAEIIQKECTLQVRGNGYDQNRFTQAVNETLKSEIAKFQKEFNSIVTANAVSQTLDLAYKKLREVCGIK